jgi:ribosomal protein S18 acetylase RimI-like enzyme
MSIPILDNPAYNAMISGNRSLSLGTETARYFPLEVSPFVGLADFSRERFAELAAVLPAGRPFALATPGKIEIPPGWDVKVYGPGLQMMGDKVKVAGEGGGVSGKAGSDLEFVPLRAEHVSQMVALAQLTNPGPFGKRTIEFGNFVGVFDGDRLMGMSGHRMHPTPYLEISGVCVHPEYTGKGLGAALTLYQVRRIREMGDIPMLHVWAHNTRAIGVYEALGFVTRREIHFGFLQLGAR